MQYLILPDDTRLPISDIAVNGGMTEFTIAVPPASLDGCYVFDDDNGGNDTAHGIMAVGLSAGIVVGTSTGARLTAILTGQKKSVL